MTDLRGREITHMILPSPQGVAGWPWTLNGNPAHQLIVGNSDWPLISIVTPSFNQAGFIEKTLRSVLLQGYPKLEYIVIDGGSTDGSVDIIKGYEERLAYWVSEPDQGQSHALNKGFVRASGEIVAWLNSDDYYTPDALARVATAFAEHPDVGLIYGDCWFLHDYDGSLELVGTEPPDFGRILAGYNVIRQPSAFMRRSAFEAAGGLNESLHLALDFDLWLRMLKHTRALRLDDDPLSVVHDHADTKSRRSWANFLAEMVGAVERFYATGNVPAEAQACRRTALGRLYFEAGAASVLGRGSLIGALPWLARAVGTDWRIARRLPGIGVQAAVWLVRRGLRLGQGVPAADRL